MSFTEEYVGLNIPRDSVSYPWARYCVVSQPSRHGVKFEAIQCQQSDDTGFFFSVFHKVESNRKCSDKF